MNITNQSKQSRQSDLYQEEKTLMFTFINNFMTKLMIDRDRLIESSNKIYENIMLTMYFFKINFLICNNDYVLLGLYKSISEENMILDEFKARMKSAHSIIIQLIGLIKVEKSVWLTSKDNNSKLFWFLLPILTAAVDVNLHQHHVKLQQN